MLLCYDSVCGSILTDAVPQVEARDPTPGAQGEVLLTADHKPDLVDVSVTRNQSDSSDDGGAVDFAEIFRSQRRRSESYRQVSSISTLWE